MSHDLPDLASQNVGGAVIWANDEFFAPKDNLVKPSEPVFKPDEYTDRGKWMDGWETRRRREPGHDTCVVRLGLPGILEHVVADTAYFEGNYPEYCRLEGAYLEGHPDPETLAEDDDVWTEIVEKSPLEGDTKNPFDVDDAQAYTHLRFHIYPAGGVARLRVRGEVMPELERLRRMGEYDLAGVHNGGAVVDASDEFFGAASNLLLPGRAENMGDGWETRRSREDDHHDWVVLRLADRGEVERLEIDTEHFKGNYPGSCWVEGTCHDGADATVEEADWQTVLPETDLQAHTRHVYESELTDRGPFTHLRLNIAPDGGLARFRAYGRLDETGWASRKLRQLNTFPPARACEAFEACCGAHRWVDAMVEGRPYDNPEELLEASDFVFDDLDEQDWLEAFAAHPRIGDDADAGDQSEQGESWSDDEQSGTDEMAKDTETRLRELNRKYYDKFGFIYIVYASGKSAEKMLEILEGRLANDRETEIENAAEAQRQITQSRLQKLLTP